MYHLHYSYHHHAIQYTIVLISLSLCFSACRTDSSDVTEPPNVSREMVITWEVDELSPALTHRLWPIDLRSVGDEVYIGGVSGDSQTSLFRYKEGKWGLVEESRRYGMGGVVSVLSTVDHNLLLVIGGDFGERVCLYAAVNGWNVIPTAQIGDPILGGTLSPNGHIYVGTGRRILKYSGIDWIELFNFDQLSDYDASSQMIEITSMCEDPVAKSLVVVARRLWRNQHSRYYLLDIAANGATVIDSLQYPLTAENTFSFGFNVQQIDQEVFSVGYGLFRVREKNVELINSDVNGVWLAGSYTTGVFFCANRASLKCCLDGNWTDVTPQFHGEGFDPMPIRGLAVVDSVVFLAAKFDLSTTVVYRGKIHYK